MTHIFLVVLLAIMLVIMILAPSVFLVKGDVQASIEIAAQVATVIVAIVAIYGVLPKYANLHIRVWNNAPDQNGALNLLVVEIENRSSGGIRIDAITASRFGRIRTWMFFLPILGKFFPKNEGDFLPIEAADCFVNVLPDGFRIYAMPISPSDKIKVSSFREDISKSVIVSIAGQDYRYIVPVKENL